MWKNATILHKQFLTCIFCFKASKTIFVLTCFDRNTPEPKVPVATFFAKTMIMFHEEKFTEIVPPVFETEWLYDAIANTGGSLAMHLHVPHQVWLDQVKEQNIRGRDFGKKMSEHLEKITFPEIQIRVPYRYPKWPTLKGGTFSKAHHFGTLQPFVFGGV